MVRDRLVRVALALEAAFPLLTAALLAAAALLPPTEF